MDEKPNNQPASGGRFGGGGNGRRPVQTGSPEPDAVEGTILKQHSKTFFKVKLDDGQEVLAYVVDSDMVKVCPTRLPSGKLILEKLDPDKPTFERNLRLAPGKRIMLELNPYNPAIGRILKRLS